MLHNDVKVGSAGFGKVICLLKSLFRFSSRSLITVLDHIWCLHALLQALCNSYWHYEEAEEDLLEYVLLFFVS